MSDTSPLLSLAIIGRLDLLPAGFRRIYIPSQVVEELRPGADLPGAEDIQKLLRADWLCASTLTGQLQFERLSESLDYGEAAVLALALELRVETVLIDDSAARRAARAMGLHPVGLLALLLDAKRFGALAVVRPVLDDLQARAGFRVARSLRDEVLRRAGESIA